MLFFFFFLQFANIVHSNLLMIFHGFKNKYGQRTGFGPNSRFYLVLGLLLDGPDRIGTQLNRLVWSDF